MNHNELDKLLINKKKYFFSFWPSKSFWIYSRKYFWISLFSVFLVTINIFADQVMMGHISKEAIQAVGITNFIILIYQGIIIGILNTIASHLSQSIRNKKYDYAQKTFDLQMFFALIASIIILLSAFFLENFFIILRTNDPKIISLTKKYYWFIIFTTLISLYAFCYRVIFNLSDKVSLNLIIIIINIFFNILISSLMIYVFDLGVVGAGIGTLASAIISFSCRLWIIKKFKYIYIIHISVLRFFYLKKSSFSNVSNTWFYLPYQFIFFGFTFFYTQIINNYYDDGLGAYIMARPFIFLFLNLTHTNVLFTKDVAKYLGDNKIKKAQKLTYMIIITNILRNFCLVIFIIIPLGFIFPYLNIYDVSPDIIKKTSYLILIVGSVYTISSTLYMSGYNIGIISGKPLFIIFVSLFSRTISVFIAYLFIYLGSNWIYLSLMLSFNHLFSSFIVFSIIFRKKSFHTLSKNFEKQYN